MTWPSRVPRLCVSAAWWPLPVFVAASHLTTHRGAAGVQQRAAHTRAPQAACIPAALEGKDIVARARTGSGKTLAYLLPALHKVLAAPRDRARAGWQALVLVPTRELCAQARPAEATHLPVSGQRGSACCLQAPGPWRQARPRQPPRGAPHGGPAVCTSRAWVAGPLRAAEGARHGRSQRWRRRAASSSGLAFDVPWERVIRSLSPRACHTPVCSFALAHWGPVQRVATLADAQLWRAGARGGRGGGRALRR